ncbi:MAG: glycoside hydrolase family 32 protein [Flavobacteriaceae bacterium]|nr:glycoside hydrolase family 32 protein [Flavobacteriaceae bacterium]
MIKSFLLLVLTGVLLISCKQKEANHDLKKEGISVWSDSVYREPYRPQFHFSPKSGWMNDPNGLVYNKGIYHLFYQYYPDSTVWGPMHWGHAVSKDLIRWQHKPVALFPDELGYIFSGSAVVDNNNTSGFGTAGNPPLVAVFTYHLMEGEKAGRNDFQTQGMAYSLDNGDTWTKYKDNPVIKNPGIRDFRDPKVFWDEDNKQWILVLVAGDHAQFYRSNNLKEWQLLSVFGKEQGSHAGVWECPDLFKLKVEGSDEDKWVLLVSINPGGPNGGSGTQYFVGDFDGKTFKSDQKQIKWVDYGADNYAGVTYNNTPDGERIFIGWMSNWNYAQKTPTEKWRSAMTLPRKLTLVKDKEDYFLQSRVVKSFDSLAKTIFEKDTVDLITPFELDHRDFSQSEVRFNLNLDEPVNIRFLSGSDEEILVAINPMERTITLDRRRSGRIHFEARFADSIHIMPFEPTNNRMDVQILLDRSSVEIFMDSGRYVMTEQLFPSVDYSDLRITSSGKSYLTNFKLNKIKSIWNEK